MEAGLRREGVRFQPLQQRHIQTGAGVAVLGRVDVGVHQPRHEELAVIHTGATQWYSGFTGRALSVSVIWSTCWGIVINGAHCGASWRISAGLKPKSCVSASSSEPWPMKAIWWQIDRNIYRNRKKAGNSKCPH